MQLHVKTAVGVHKARQVAKSFGLPIVGVHHMEAHALVSRYLTNRAFAVQLTLILNRSVGL